MIIKSLLTLYGKIGAVAGTGFDDAAGSVFASALQNPAVFLGTIGYVFQIMIVAVVVFLSVVLPLLFIVPMILNWRNNRHLLKNGEPAQAKILKIWDTGVTVNNNPQVGLRLEIYAPDRAVYEAETKSLVPRLQIPQIQVGALVEVRYDANDPSNVALLM